MAILSPFVKLIYSFHIGLDLLDKPRKGAKNKNGELRKSEGKKSLLRRKQSDMNLQSIVCEVYIRGQISRHIQVLSHLMTEMSEIGFTGFQFL